MCSPAEQQLSNREYVQQFRAKAVRERVPVTGSLDLTLRCNLRCVHCYVGPTSSRGREGELTAKEIRRIIDEIAAGGCLFLLMTGGEALLREDFPEIYGHAIRSGLLVTLFTNGTLVDNGLLELFSERSPQAVEVSLYGATAETYESITRVRGSYERCIAGIRQLHEAGVSIQLKTMLMTLNRHEFFAMEELAEELGVPFRFDAALFPRLNGDTSPLALRVLPEEAIAKEFTSKDKTQRWKQFFDKYRGVPISDDVYQCNAGVTNFHINAQGYLKPCMMTDGVEYNLLEGAFRDGWERIGSALRQRKIHPANPCRECEKKVLCGYCPAFFQLETGSENAFSEYLCTMGRLRAQEIDREFGFSLTRNGDHGGVRDGIC